MTNKIITLPKPITVNKLYRYTCRGGFPSHYTSQEGKDWFEEAGYLLKSQWKKRTPIEDEVSVYMKLYICGRYDIDNGNKALFDLLVKQGVLKDDSQITFLQIEKIKVKHKEGQKVEVEIV